MDISTYECVYKSERLCGDKTNAKGLICAHSNREALYLAEDLVKNIKERMEKNGEYIPGCVDHSRVDDLDT